MITFEKDGKQFNHRVVGVAIHEGQVLLHRAEWEDFWSLPGGRVELLEASPDALRREMREELGIEIEVDRPLWVAENFFQYGGKAFHELGLYFLISFPHDSPLYHTASFEGNEADVPLLFQWFPLAALSGMRLYPSFLSTGLQTLPNTIQHIVHHDIP